MLLHEQNKFQGNPYMAAISKAWFADEKSCVQSLTRLAKATEGQTLKIQHIATKLVENVRKERLSKSGLDAFMVQYDLSSDEGIVLMCLAEALLRVPDKFTADKLIKDKLTSADWESHLGTSDSMFVNAATWSLMLTGKIINPDEHNRGHFSRVMRGFLKNRSKPVIRRSALQGMKILGQQYVMGETIKAALKRARSFEKKGYTYSYDMLGEAASTKEDAEFYFKAYYDSIVAIGGAAKTESERTNPGISVKMSALHPRYEFAQSDRIHAELYPKLLELMELAKKFHIGLNIDAEETERLEISLELVERLAHEPSLKGWHGIGIVVQAYQKRAPYVLDFLVDLAQRVKTRFMIRLVKGAYWDAEIKHAQTEGFSGYPVFTRKCYTDVSYQACVKKIFANTDFIYPQFATHNALTVATVMEFAGDYTDFEFQCLHGMGDALYDHVVGKKNLNIPCRIYAPVGTYDCLLPYLVRRLLENGANSSFVNRIVDEQVPIAQLIEDPADKAERFGCEPHPEINLPLGIFGAERQNAKGYNINDPQEIKALKKLMDDAQIEKIHASPLIFKHKTSEIDKITVVNPANTSEAVGTVIEANASDVNVAMDKAQAAFERWDQTPAKERAECLFKMANLLEDNMPRLMAIAIKEAGKTLSNAIAEVREAIDFCRYYAVQAVKDFSGPTELPGPTGERNLISLHGRGVIVCISPWNFPLAIFLGQVTAAIAAGNTVVAKPAEQTPLIAFEAVKLLYQAGVPEDVLQLLPGDGATVGAGLIENKHTAGVIFTGSTEVAHIIQKTLVSKQGAIIPLIAETGGQNTLVADSSALSEQIVGDVINSAFDSAGQRCSALRVLYLQEDIADGVLEMLEGAMKELTVSDPRWLSTDVGPVIDEEAQANLLAHIEKMKSIGKLRYQVTLDAELSKGTYVPPTVFEIKHLSDLKREVFGPILHVVRFKAKELQKVIDEINATGYGLTFGIHSRIQETVDFFVKRARVGNIYVNRNIVGAVVGVQPFGGQGLSGTGPKAGGPMYLHKLAVERTVSIDTTASGGNASLMTIGD